MKHYPYPRFRRDLRRFRAPAVRFGQAYSAALTCLAFLVCLGVTGCKSPVNTEYGRSADDSINGVGGFAALLKNAGWQVEPVVRIKDNLQNSSAIVWFSQFGGPSTAEETDWINRWLYEKPDRRFLYVCNDYVSQKDFWTGVRNAQPADAPAERLERIDRLIDDGPNIPSEYLRMSRTKMFQAQSYLPLFDTLQTPVSLRRRLAGRWADELRSAAESDAPAVESDVPTAADHSSALPALFSGIPAGIVLTLRPRDNRFEDILLADDAPSTFSGKPEILALEYTYDNGSRLLVLANASFLLNSALVMPERRPYAEKTLDWLGPPSGRLAFVEGISPLRSNGGEESPSLALFLKKPLVYVFFHLVIFGMILALMFSKRLGAPRASRSDEVLAAERPVAHPLAVGELLARTRDRDRALELLRTYRRWRFAGAASVYSTQDPVSISNPVIASAPAPIVPKDPH